MGERYCEAFVRIVECAQARGYQSIKDLSYTLVND
jgi:hypothetical protein